VAEGSATRFDEHCRPLPKDAAASGSEAAAVAPDGSAPPAGAGSLAGIVKPAIAPTPAPPDLARAQPQRFVLMVEVQAQHDPGARP
jgi:hypothetical protein